MISTSVCVCSDQFQMLCFLSHCLLHAYEKGKAIHKLLLSWPSVPQFHLSPTLEPFKPCPALWGCKRAGRLLFYFFKGLEGRPACIYTQHKQQRERLRHKGTPAWRRRSSAYRRGRVEMRASESSVCVCAHVIDCQLNPINRHWTNQSTLELLDATNSIYFSANNCTSEACDAKFCPWPSCFLCGRQL